MSDDLRARCVVNRPDSNSGFVGVRADSDGAHVYFPIGYRLPNSDAELRADIHNLFGILSAFMKEDRLVESSSFESREAVEFPIHAYLTLIRDFLSTGRYYTEVESVCKTDTEGRVLWARTVREQRLLLNKNGSPVFVKMTVRHSKPNESREITQLHKYCVYEAFEKLGWLYVTYLPEKPDRQPDIRSAIVILTRRLASTNNDTEQSLLGAMRSMLEYIDRRGSALAYSFGTEHFENVWERMLDKAFGIEGKESYSPRTRWLLDGRGCREKRPLCPDSIMIYRDKYYVIDAKYYRFGLTGNPEHLPNSSDINKQITYGEYVERVARLPNERLFNCFIMPFDRACNPFGITEPVGNIGEAVGDWRYDADNPKPKNYERIQGIVMDTRYLMYNHLAASDRQRRELAECIERVLTRDALPPIN